MVGGSVRLIHGHPKVVPGPVTKLSWQQQWRPSVAQRHGSPYQGTFVLWPLLNSNLSGAETNIESPPVMGRIPLCDQQATWWLLLTLTPLHHGRASYLPGVWVCLICPLCLKQHHCLWAVRVMIMTFMIMGFGITSLLTKGCIYSRNWATGSTGPTMCCTTQDLSA